MLHDRCISVSKPWLIFLVQIFVICSDHVSKMCRQCNPVHALLWVLSYTWLVLFLSSHRLHNWDRSDSERTHCEFLLAGNRWFRSYSWFSFARVSPLPASVSTEGSLSSRSCSSITRTGSLPDVLIPSIQVHTMHQHRVPILRVDFICTDCGFVVSKKSKTDLEAMREVLEVNCSSNFVWEFSLEEPVWLGHFSVVNFSEPHNLWKVYVFCNHQNQGVREERSVWMWYGHNNSFLSGYCRCNTWADNTKSLTESQECLRWSNTKHRHEEKCWSLNNKMLRNELRWQVREETGVRIVRSGIFHLPLWWPPLPVTPDALKQWLKVFFCGLLISPSPWLVPPWGWPPSFPLWGWGGRIRLFQVALSCHLSFALSYNFHGQGIFWILFHWESLSMRLFDLQLFSVDFIAQFRSPRLSKIAVTSAPCRHCCALVRTSVVFLLNLCPNSPQPS